MSASSTQFTYCHERCVHHRQGLMRAFGPPTLIRKQEIGPQSRFNRAMPGKWCRVDDSRMGPAVRTASLLERRGSEPAVLFVVFGAYERLEVFNRVTALKPIRELLSERFAGKFWPKNGRTSARFQRGKRGPQ